MTENECGEVGLALMEDVVEECIAKLEVVPETKVPKPVMVSLKEQLRRNATRMQIKKGQRMMKNPPVNTPVINIGNKDHGVPYSGKDKFGGMFRKFADRIEYNHETGVHRLHYADNNKYNANGTLKD